MADTRSDHIRDGIRRDIVSGRLVPGERLPTERLLSTRYGVSLTTINKVMAGLELEGLLERRRGAGTFVRPELADRALAVVLGPPDASPGPALRAAVLRAVVDAAGGGLRTYMAAAPEQVDGSALARDAAGGRLHGALLLGVPPAVADGLDRIGVPLVRLMDEGPGRCVRVAWQEAAADGFRRMLGRGAWPAAVQLPPGRVGREIAEAVAEVASEAARPVPKPLTGPAEQADGPAGWGWARQMLRRPEVRGFAMLGDEPGPALVAAMAGRDGAARPAALLVRTVGGGFAGAAVPFARLDVDPVAVAQAGLALLAEVQRSEPPGGALERTVRPRYLAEEATW